MSNVEHERGPHTPGVPSGLEAFGAEFMAALGAAVVPGGVAAFDADGTLWPADASDTLLDWVDARRLIAPPEGSSGCRAHCDLLCATDRYAGYRYATAVYAGLPEARVSEWAHAAWQESGGAHPEMAALVTWLRERGVRVVIVSASPVWAALPGATLLGFQTSDVFAMDVEREGERLTGQVKVPTTAGEGKVERLRRELGHTQLVLGAGNTVDDLPMIRCGTVGLVINPTVPHGSTRGGPDLATLAAAEGLWVRRTTAQV